MQTPEERRAAKRAETARYMAKKRAAATAAGLCPRCMKVPSRPGKTNCAACSAKAIENTYRLREKYGRFGTKKFPVMYTGLVEVASLSTPLYNLFMPLLPGLLVNLRDIVDAPDLVLSVIPYASDEFLVMAHSTAPEHRLSKVVVDRVMDFLLGVSTTLALQCLAK